MSGNLATARTADEFADEPEAWVWGFMHMPCDAKRRAADANERALALGGTPKNIRMTVQRELSELEEFKGDK